MLVIADGDKKKADALATKLGEELVSLRGKTQPPSFDVAAGVGQGVEFNDLPVVIADPADNAGGGAPSDNTDIVRHLIDGKVENACLGPIWDPIAVRICLDAGLGAKIGLRFGGKIAKSSGQPVDAEVEIIGLKRDAWQSFGPTQVPVGDCAAVRVGGVDVVLDLQAHAGDRPGALHQPRHRSDAEEDRRGEVDQSFHGGLRPDRQEGDLCRIRAGR